MHMFMLLTQTMIQHLYNPSIFVSLIRLLLNTASETSRLIPVWEINFRTIAPRYLMLVLLKSGNFRESLLKIETLAAICKWNPTHSNTLAKDLHSPQEQMTRNVLCHLAAIAGATILVPCHVVKSLQFIWRSGTRRFHLRVPNLQMNCIDLTWR